MIKNKSLICFFILLFICLLSVKFIKNEKYYDYQNSCCYSQYLHDIIKYPYTNPFYFKERQWKYQGFPMNL